MIRKKIARFFFPGLAMLTRGFRIEIHSNIKKNPPRPFNF